MIKKLLALLALLVPCSMHADIAALKFNEQTGQVINSSTSAPLNFPVGQITISAQALGPSNKIITVSTETDRYALTSSSVNPLDWVKVTTPDDEGNRNVYGVVSLNGTNALSTDLYWIHLGTFLLVPTNTVAPVLSATEAYLSTAISTGTGTWTDFPTGYNYQWQSSATGTSSWTNISGGTSGTYTPVSGDVGNYLRSSVAAINGSGTSAAVFSSAVITGSNDLDSGLVAYWKLNEASGTRFDSVGSFNLTDNNSTGSTTGLIGNCAVAAGSNWLNTTTPFNFSADFTINVWFKGSGFTNFNAQIVCGVFYSGLNIYIGSDTNVNYGLAGISNNISATVSAIDLTTWHMITLTRISGAVTLYLDGASIGTATDTTDYSGTYGLFAAPDGTDAEAVGEIDETGIWYRGLSSGEVTQLYSGGAGVTLP